MEFFNSLNLTQIKGGTKLKQGDFGSVLSYSLTDENGQEITSFDTKTAYINLVLDDKIWFTTTTLVDISRVTFRIDKAIPTGLYYLEIKIDDYIFPSDRDSIILIEEGSTPYDLKELVPNYDINMTIKGILSDLSQKGIDISVLDNKQKQTTAQLQQTVDYINNRTRKFKPKICNNLWFVGRNETTMRNMVQSQLDMGIEGFILCFHLNANATNDGFTVQENIVDMLKVATEFYKKGVYFSALKFHCTDSGLATSTTLQNAYKALVLSYINMFNELGIKHCIIFNERNDIFRTENIGYVQGLLNDIKSLGLKVSINANSTGTMIANYRDFSDVASIYDFISVNMYPKIGANGRATTLTDCVNAWEEHSKFNNILSSNKPFILTETGMRPYWIYFSAPAGYEYDDPNDYSIDAQILYFKGLFESGMNVLADEVWLWFFPEFYDEKIARLIRYYTGKGDL